MSGLNPWRTRLLWIGAALAIGLTLAACGKRGSPIPPPGVTNTYPRTYPSE